MSLFITLEGGEGSGKTSISKLLKEKLNKDGFEVVLTREPGGTESAELMRDIILKENLTPESEALLFAAARAQHTFEKIMPEVESGKIVICDRWLGSSLAYQGYTRKLGIDRVEAINDFALGGFRPHVSYFIDIEPKKAFARIGERTLDRMELEGMDFHNSVYDYFKNEYSKLNYVKTIDGDNTLENITNKIYEDILLYLK